MAQVFVSYVEEDKGIAEEIVTGLEAAGLTTWSFTRNALPGPSYLLKIGNEIIGCEAMLVIISRNTLGSTQVGNEIVRGFEAKKYQVPILVDVSHAELQELRLEWLGAFGAATSVQISSTGARSVIPRLLAGLAELNVVPGEISEAVERFTSQSNVNIKDDCAGSTATVNLSTAFDHSAYMEGEDPLAFFVAELRLTPSEVFDEAPGVDISLVLDVSGSMDKPNRYPLLCDALRRFIAGLRSQDRLSIALFAGRSETVLEFTPGDIAFQDSEKIISAMNNSPLLFGAPTNLSPALRLVLEEFDYIDSSARVRRVYILTDGAIRDTAECEVAIREFRPRHIETHVYGFGDEFDPSELKLLVSDQIGGTVKPICNESDIVRTFAHVAALNRRLVGQQGRIVITFAPEVTCGDAWVASPVSRYLGAINGRQVTYAIGGVESGRAYSLLLEIRLPVGSDPIGVLQVEWIERNRPVVHSISIAPVRIPPPARMGRALSKLSENGIRPYATDIPVSMRDVRRIVDVLLVLRSEDDKKILLRSYKARRELAVLENRDPNLIAALDRAIANLSLDKESEASNADAISAPCESLTLSDELYLKSDSRTMLPFQR